MKAFLFLASFVLAAAATSYEDIFLQEWNLYKAEFNKSYETPADDYYRMKIYQNNKYSVATHNLKYLAGEVSYEMGINKFSDMLPEEVDEIYNGFNKENRLRAKDGEEPELPELDAEPFVPSPEFRAPASVNWVEKGAVNAVRNQGKCGSCYAFAALGALEGHYYLKTRSLVNLSPQNIVDCSGKYGNQGCNGGLAEYTYAYIKANGGVNKESTYPYEGRQGQCRFKPNDVSAKCVGYAAVSKGSENSLKDAVAMGPVAIAVDASLASFQQYKGGIYNDPKCSSTRLGHAVLAVGYGTDAATKKDYWLVKNSWGPSWGERGYIKIARNAGNRCGVATHAVYPRV